MQYRSSATIWLTPRTCPAIRLSLVQIALAFFWHMVLLIPGMGMGKILRLVLVPFEALCCPPSRQHFAQADRCDDSRISLRAEIADCGQQKQSRARTGASAQTGPVQCLTPNLPALHPFRGFTNTAAYNIVLHTINA